MYFLKHLDNTILYNSIKKNLVITKSSAEKLPETWMQFNLVNHWPKNNPTHRSSCTATGHPRVNKKLCLRF